MRMNPASEVDSQLEHLVFEIAQGVSGQTGVPFFRSLVRHLAAALEAEFVLVGTLQPGGERVKALAVHGGQDDTFEYDLAGTPCEDVVQRQLCFYPSGIQQMFPQDAMLRQMDAEGYVGVPLIDSGGRCLGLVCALTRRPLASPKLAEALLKIFAIRASSELERKNYEEALAHSEQRLRDFVERGKEAIVRVDLEQPIPLDLPEDEQIELAYRYGYVADCNDQAARLFDRNSASELIGVRLDAVAPRDDPDQIERLRVGFRVGWKNSQVERTLRGRTLLMTRDGMVENGKAYGAWLTARDITELKASEAEVRRLNTELEARVQELTELKGRLEQDNAYLLEEI